MKAMKLTVLHAQTFEPMGPVTLRVDEIVMLQEYAEVEDKNVPALETEQGDMIPATLIKGAPAHTVVTLHSGLQFRVSESESIIQGRLGWTCG